MILMLLFSLFFKTGFAFEDSRNVSRDKANFVIGGSYFDDKDNIGCREYLRGATAYINRIADDKEDYLYPRSIFYGNSNMESTDASNTNRLIFSDNIDIAFGFSFRETMLDNIRLFTENNIPFVFPFFHFRKDELEGKNIAHFNLTIEEDLDKMAEFTKEENFKNILIFVNEDDKWQAEYIESKIMENSSEDMLETSIVSFADKLNPSIVEIYKKKPELIIILGQSERIFSIISRVSSAFLREKNFKMLIPSYVLGATFEKRLRKYAGDLTNLYAVKVTPNLQSDLEIVKEYKRDLETLRSDDFQSSSSLDGYIAMRMVIAYARRKIELLGKLDVHDRGNIDDDSALSSILDGEEIIEIEEDDDSNEDNSDMKAEVRSHTIEEVIEIINEEIEKMREEGVLNPRIEQITFEEN